MDIIYRHFCTPLFFGNWILHIWNGFYTWSQSWQDRTSWLQELTPPLAVSFSWIFWCVQKTDFFYQKTLFYALISGSKFSHLLTVRAEGADPPLTVNLTVKCPFFDDFPLRSNRPGDKADIDHYRHNGGSGLFQVGGLCSIENAKFGHILTNFSYFIA